MESKLQEKVLRYLHDNKIWHFRYTASTTFGLPDIMVLYKGYFIGIELKREDLKGKPTYLQISVVESIKRNGGLAAIVASLESVESLFKSIDNGEVDLIWRN